MKNLVVKGDKHFCASVWILTDSKPKKMLLVHHKKFNKWLQPGGHIERSENPVETAIREIREETGIDISSLTKQIKVADLEGKFLPVPKFIMEQTIPQTDKQPSHFHIDLQYVLEVPIQNIISNPGESLAIGWFTKEEILQLPIHKDTEIVIQELM